MPQSLVRHFERMLWLIKGLLRKSPGIYKEYRILKKQNNILAKHKVLHSTVVIIYS